MDELVERVARAIREIHMDFHEEPLKMNATRDDIHRIATAALEAAGIRELVEALESCVLQLEYMHERSPSGTTPATITRARTALARVRGL